MVELSSWFAGPVAYIFVADTDGVVYVTKSVCLSKVKYSFCSIVRPG